MYLRAFVFAVLAAFASPGLTKERITDFVSDVTVNPDASLTVRETIVVIAEGDAIKRGIFRDFPFIYQDRNGQRVIAGFKVDSVTRNGLPEQYSLESLSNGTRIRIGDKDVFLRPSEYRYDITYHTTRQIGFFESYDELYWNVTGNGWLFSVDRARVIIRLPGEARIGGHAFYTGYACETGTDARPINAEGNVFEAATTRSLKPNEGFTVAINWQKGIVTPPSDSQKWVWWISDNLGLFALALGFVASFAYFLLAWNRVGRDPLKGNHKNNFMTK